MNDLDKLAIKYKADKWGKHHYTPVYYDLFKDRRESVKKVLEIGVAEGASLFMWRDFFPNAMIYGIDNKDNRIFRDLPIYVYKADQSKSNELLEVLDEILPGPNDLDLIIDDGSHKPEDQINTCVTLLKTNALRYGDTVYVIEDVADDNLKGKLMKELITNIKGVTFRVDTIRVGKRYDDKLIIVRHKV